MNRPLLISIISLAITLAIGLVLTLPKYQEMRYAQKKVQAKETEIQNKQGYFSKINEASEKLKKYPKELAKIDFALPANVSLPFLYDFFQKISSQNGLVLENISGGPASVIQPKISSGSEINIQSEIGFQSEKAVQEIKVNLSLAGSYSAFKNFLSSIEKSARMIEVESMSFSFPKEEGESLSFSLTVKTHSY